jgi:succinate-semialdehyde dehydrogenase
MKTFKTINPATGAELHSYTYHTDQEAELIVARSSIAYAAWRDCGVNARAEKLLALEKALLNERDRLAELVSDEMGKLLADAKAEVEKCAKLAGYFALNGGEFLKNEKAPITEIEAYVSYEPLGPILAVMPWNFPLWQAMRFAIPTLLAGNTILLKHAHSVQGSALAIEKVFLDAGFPLGVFQNLILEQESIKAIVKNPRVCGVTLTGSTRAGEALASQAGAALKKCVLELGGSDAFIVLADADLKKAAVAAAKSRFGNAGQVCIAAKRFIVVESVFSEFQKYFLEQMQNLHPGDPKNPQTTLAPIARADLRDELHQQVQKSIDLGAKLITGGKPVPGPGSFYEATLLTDAKPGMPIFEDEIFGPVATLFSVKDAPAAIKLANENQYGLSSALWTTNIEEAKKLATQIEAGGVFINSISQSDPRIPIGGVKRSGFGRELSHFGIREFTNVKAVWIGKP